MKAEQSRLDKNNAISEIITVKLYMLALEPGGLLSCRSLLLWLVGLSQVGGGGAVV